MPVCIAALCENGRMVIVASDRLRGEQWDALMPQEMNYARLKAFNHMLFLSSCRLEETEKVFARAVQLAGDSGNVPVEAFADGVMKAQEEIPISRRRQGSETGASPLPASGPDGAPRAWNSQAEFLVVGMEAGKPKIYRINEAGKFAVEGGDYAVIGDGEPTSWAALAMLAFSQRIPLPDAVFTVYRAKKAGECYVRVGLDTDLAILNGNGIRLFDDSSIQLLEDICHRQQKPFLGLAGRRLIERHIAQLPYHGVPKLEKATAVPGSHQGQEPDPDEDLAWWEPMMMFPASRGEESANASPEPVPCYHFGGPYQPTCDVTPDEARHLDERYIPVAVAKTAAEKREVFGRLQCAFFYDADHPAIKDWARLTHGVLKYLLNPKTMAEVDLPCARDVIVRLSQWYHAESEYWRRYQCYLSPVVETLWGKIDRFRDQEGNRVWHPG